MALKYVQAPTFYLSGSGVIVGAITVNLASLTDIYGNVLTMADFGAKGYGTLEPDTSNEEAFTFTGITPNANGTYSLTGVSTVLAKSAYTETSGLVRAHSGGTKIVITDSAAFWNTFANKNNDEIISGNWTFNTAPAALSATNASTTVLGNVKLTSTPFTTLGTATITIASPAVVTLNSHGLIAGDSIQFTTTGSLPTGLATATNYYVIATGLGANSFEISATVGGVAINTSGTQSGTHTLIRTTPFAVGNDDTRLPTQAENDAMQGSAGTPSNTNRYVTVANEFKDIDQSQATQDSSVSVGEADASSKHNLISQSFIPAVPRIRGVRLYKAADTGTFTGNVKVAIQIDASGSPSGVDLASGSMTNAAWLAFATGEIEAVLTSEATMTIGGTYWIVITPSTSDNANHPNLGQSSSGGYASGSVKYKNTTDGWVSIATVDLYFKTLDGGTGQIATGDATIGMLPSSIVPYALYDMNVSSATVTATTAATSVYKKNLPASALKANSGFKLRVYGTFGGAAASPTSNINLKLNGTSIANPTTPTLFTGAALQFEFEVIVLGNNSTSSQNVILRLLGIHNNLQNTGLTTTTFAGGASIIGISTSALDVSGGAVIEVFMQNSSASQSSVFSGATIEKIAIV